MSDRIAGGQRAFWGQSQRCRFLRYQPSAPPTAAEPQVFDALRPGARVLTLSWGIPISLIARGNEHDLRGEVCEE